MYSDNLKEGYETAKLVIIVIVNVNTEITEVFFNYSYSSARIALITYVVC